MRVIMKNKDTEIEVSADQVERMKEKGWSVKTAKKGAKNGK